MNNKTYKIKLPKHYKQLEFEDQVKEMIKIMATLPEEKNNQIFDFVQTVAFIENK